MKKLIQGIIEFKKKLSPEYQEKFAHLALGQSPDTLFITCSDSRVAPNLFASTDPGDLFVIRNPGNLFPPCGNQGISMSDESEVAALEFAVEMLGVRDIIVCGHSECGAMKALYDGREKISLPHLQSWLGHGVPAFENLKALQRPPSNIAPHNLLSQYNVLQQIKNLKSYPLVQKFLNRGSLQIHGWWFDIAHIDVYAYHEQFDEFRLISEELMINP